MDPVLLHARLRPNSLACIDLATNRRWTYSELNCDIQRAAAVLTEQGVRPGDRVATISVNNVHQIILQQALMKLGAVHVPLNWRLAPPELTTLLSDCTPVLVFTDLDPPELPLGCRQIHMSTFAAAVDDAVPRAHQDTRPSHETCIVLYTSGSSGVPKGVTLTAQSIFATTRNFSIVNEIDTNSVFLCDLPMFHIMGLIAQTFSALVQGATFVVSAKFNPEATNTRLGDDKLRVTHYFCVPQMAESLARAPNFNPSAWKSLKALCTGGAPNPSIRIKFWLARGIRMVDGYGSTETGLISNMPLSCELIESKAGSVGLMCPSMGIRVVDERGQEVPTGALGEIIVSGPSITPGYWNRPEENLTALTNDGGFRTGDIGRIDEDGYIFLIDRRKNMFISGGENVYPAEVEAALIEHPEVVDAAVVGVPDHTWGEAGRAYVIARPDSQLTHEDLISHCRSLVARYKIPRETIFVSDFPRTGSGKVQKNVLSEGSSV
jgi:fatty-acyl-CoA synthase